MFSQVRGNKTEVLVSFCRYRSDKQTITVHLSRWLIALLTCFPMQKVHGEKYWLPFAGMFIAERGFVHLICIFYIHFRRLYAVSVAVEMGRIEHVEAI